MILLAFTNYLLATSHGPDATQGRCSFLLERFGYSGTKARTKVTLEVALSGMVENLMQYKYG